MRFVARGVLSIAFVSLAFGCGGDSSGDPDSSTPDGTAGPDASSDGPSKSDVVESGGPPILPAACNGSVASTSTPATGLPTPPSALTPATGLKLEVIAQISSARELVALPNGDLLVGTNGSSVYIVPNAEADAAPGKSQKFATVADSYAQGIAYDPLTCTVYLGSHANIWSLKYQDGQLTGDFGTAIAKVRTGNVAPNTDGDVHVTTSVAFGGGKLYAGVGSGCNACTEIDPTRATVQMMNPDGSNMTTKGARFRNAIALATNPMTGNVWAGGAGQDSLPLGHPYEFFDGVTLHSGTADYGWPDCEENHNDFGSGANCTNAVAPLIELPAYSTIIGAAFYPTWATGAHVFPSKYLGGLFLAGHGSWHTSGSSYFSAPRLVFVAMNGDAPVTPVDWTDPTKQFTDVVGGWQDPNSQNRHGRPTGVAVGYKGSLFFSDDANGYVYRVRPN
jgi:glucose/arabinose dehydrogenase